MVRSLFRKPTAHRADLTFRVQLAVSAFSLVADPDGIGPAGTNTAGKMAELQRADQQTLERSCRAYAKAKRGIEHIVRQRNRRPHRNHIATEQRQFRPGFSLALRVAHRWRRRHLRRCADRALQLVTWIALIGLMRGSISL